MVGLKQIVMPGAFIKGLLGAFSLNSIFMSTLLIVCLSDVAAGIMENGSSPQSRKVSFSTEDCEPMECRSALMARLEEVAERTQNAMIHEEASEEQLLTFEPPSSEEDPDGTGLTTNRNGWRTAFNSPWSSSASNSKSLGEFSDDDDDLEEAGLDFNESQEVPVPTDPLLPPVKADVEVPVVDSASMFLPDGSMNPNYKPVFHMGASSSSLKPKEIKRVDKRKEQREKLFWNRLKLSKRSIMKLRKTIHPTRIMEMLVAQTELAEPTEEQKMAFTNDLDAICGNLQNPFLSEDQNARGSGSNSQ